MQFQVKIICCLALLSSLSTRAAEVDWELFKSKNTSVEPYASAQGEVISLYIPFFTTIGNAIWSWDPKLEPKNTSDNILREPENLLNETMKSLFVEFDISDKEHFRKVWFQVSPHIKVRGLFGVHDDDKKRPLVILRMGIHGNVDEFVAERFLAKIIYEDLDANFLAIESLTSHAFLTTNQTASLGGVDEGIQTFLIWNEIETMKFKEKISSMHLLSVSMGSHGTFVAAILDQVNGRKIKSILNFCPLVNLKDTFDSHFVPNLQNTLIDLWNVRRLGSVFSIFPDKKEIRGWSQVLLDQKPRFTKGVLEILQTERKTPLISAQEVESSFKNMKWPKGFKEHLENSDNFYALNDFWKLYKNIKTPMMIYTTPNDPLVNNKINAEKIFRGQQEGDFSMLHYQRLEKGIHCGLPSVYQWPYIVKLVKEGLGI